MNHIALHIFHFRFVCLGIFLVLSFGASAQTAQFEYDLKITADPAKRAAYLKEAGST